MKQLNRANAQVGPPKTERILQFGGGNFLRAFVDWMIDVYNHKYQADMGVLLVAPISRDNYTKWQEQDGLYHVLTRGYKDGATVEDQQLISCVSRILHLYGNWPEYLRSAENPDMRFIVSNTTEAGIRYSPDDRKTDEPPVEFPAKLTLWLYRRYQYFQGASDKGCIIIPVELILRNGEVLQSCILQNAKNWGLEQGFSDWVLHANTFCNTLVDRIVPGVERAAWATECEKLGYEDYMITQGEAFHFWVIEAAAIVQRELPLDQAGLNVIFTDDLSPYRTRKVRILNGAHTAMVPVGYLLGLKTVRDAVRDDVMGRFIEQAIFREIIPTLDLPQAALVQYAQDVLDRFRNPFLHHQLLSISLNSVAKYKTRVLPSLLAYQKRTGQSPDCLTLALAALIHFYKGEYKGEEIPLKDDPEAIRFLQEEWQVWNESGMDFARLARRVLAWEYAWGEDLSLLPGLPEKLTAYLRQIQLEGMQKTLSWTFGESPTK